MKDAPWFSRMFQDSVFVKNVKKRFGDLLANRKKYMSVLIIMRELLRKE